MKDAVDPVGLAYATGNLKSLRVFASNRHGNVKRKIGMGSFDVMGVVIAIEKANLIPRPDGCCLRDKLKVLLINHDRYRLADFSS